MSHPSTWSLLTRLQLALSNDRLGVMDDTDGVTKGILPKEILAPSWAEIVTHSAGTIDLTANDIGKMHVATSGNYVFRLPPANHGDVIWIAKIGLVGGTCDVTATAGTEGFTGPAITLYTPDAVVRSVRITNPNTAFAFRSVQSMHADSWLMSSIGGNFSVV